MALAEILITKLGTRLGKILLKAYLEDPAEAIGSELLDIAKGKIEGALDRRDAARRFERIGEKIASQLEPLFESEFRHDEVSTEAVILELAQALEGRISSEFFLRKDLDPAKITAELRKGHPLPKNQFSDADEQLYDRALAEAVRYVVEVVDKLPRFQATHVKESLRRLSHLEDSVEVVLQDVKKIASWVDLQEKDADSRKYELDYRLAVIRNLDYLELFGADISPESKKQALSVAYVSLTLDAVGEGGEEPQPSPVEAVLRSFTPDSGRLLLRGNAGSGKSTLFRWAAINAAQGLILYALSKTQAPNNLGQEFWCENDFSALGSLSRKVLWQSSSSSLHDAWNNLYLHGIDSRGLSVVQGALRKTWLAKIPFLIRLRDCRGGKLPAPDEFPSMIAKEIGTPPSAWVRSVLDSGRALLLFDGIDEVPELHRETTRKEIGAIIGAFPENYFLVSSRPQAVPEGWLASLGFREALVNPMSEVDRERFIDKWHEAVALELARMGKPSEDLPWLAVELKKELPENPPVARLATNPLLCAMICALHRDRGQKLPESQSELCEALSEVLLHRRERESGLDLSEFPEPYRRLKYPQKKAIVQAIAHSMVLNGESSITVERAREKIADALRSLSGQSEEDASIICQSLVERSGMLRETKPGHIDFIHNTFKEYLAAERFANAGDAGVLAEHALDTTWQRVIQFAVATPRQGFADQVIRRILESGQKAELRPAEAKPKRGKKAPVEGTLRARQVLALQCRAAALYVDPGLEADLDAMAKSLLPPKSMGDAEALAAAGDLVVPFLAYRPNLPKKAAAASVRTLRLVGTQRARLVLEGYFEDEREGVVAELAQAVNPLLLKVVRETLLGGGILSKGVRSQIKDLGPLSGLSGLQSLDLSDSQVSDISPLSGLSSLQSLDLSGTRVSDISPLSGLSGLQNLDLDGTRVTDISPLSGLSSLQNLDLDSTQVSDISPLSGLSGLQRLNLVNTQVGDISPLSGLSGLQNLDLSITQVSDLSPLSGLSGLRSLNLVGTQVSDISPLSGLRGLQSLDLSYMRVSDVSPLSGLSGLQTLYLIATRVSDVSPLSGLSGLRSLDLENTEVRDVSSLSRLSGLRSLDLRSTQVSDISPLSGLSGLQDLSLFDTQVSDVSALSHLVDLTIYGFREGREEG